MPVVCLINRWVPSSAHALGQAQTVCAVSIIAQQGPDCLGGTMRNFGFFYVCGWYKTSRSFSPDAETEHVCSDPIAGALLPRQPSQRFPHCRQGNTLGKWVRGRRDNATTTSCSQRADKSGFSSDVSPHLSQGVHIPVHLSTTPFVLRVSFPARKEGMSDRAACSPWT